MQGSITPYGIFSDNPKNFFLPSPILGTPRDTALTGVQGTTLTGVQGGAQGGSGDLTHLFGGASPTPLLPIETVRAGIMAIQVCRDKLRDNRKADSLALVWMTLLVYSQVRYESIFAFGMCSAKRGIPSAPRFQRWARCSSVAF